MLSNNESIHGTDPVKEMTPAEGIFFAQKTENDRQTIYVFLNKYRNEIEIPIELSKISSCTVLESGMPLTTTRTSKGFNIQVPKQFEKDCAVQVFKIVL